MVLAVGLQPPLSVCSGALNLGSSTTALGRQHAVDLTIITAGSGRSSVVVAVRWSRRPPAVVDGHDRSLASDGFRGTENRREHRSRSVVGHAMGMGHLREL